MLYEILRNIEHPGLFLMKIHPVERKLYQIINGGTTALVYDESVFVPLLIDVIKSNYIIIVFVTWIS